MRRRDFTKVIAVSAAAWPLAARAQQASRVRVGFVDFAGENDPNALDRALAFKRGLERLGWTPTRLTTTGVSLTSKGRSARLGTLSNLHQM
jgi:hypothetical protein